jgi:hypothetical protein
MLWLMRRPWMKRAQLAPLSYLPPTLREKASVSHIKQNRFARRVGLPMLNVVYVMFLATLLLSCCVRVAVELHERGMLSAPQQLRDKVGYPEE